MRSVQMSGRLEVEGDGTYSIYRDRITVRASDGTKFSMRVKVDGRRLRFSDVEPAKGDALPWTAHPLVRID